MLLSLLSKAKSTPEFGDRRDIYYDAHHPYTWGLLQSISRLDQPKVERLRPIPGLPPSLIAAALETAFVVGHWQIAGAECIVVRPRGREKSSESHAGLSDNWRQIVDAPQADHAYRDFLNALSAAVLGSLPTFTLPRGRDMDGPLADRDGRRDRAQALIDRQSSALRATMNQLAETNSQLDQRIQERTAALRAVNQTLRSEIEERREALHGAAREQPEAFFLEQASFLVAGALLWLAVDWRAVTERPGVRVALEAHPGFAVYNPETLLRLRQQAGANVGANFDPSHFFWQGIQPVEAARVLGEAGALFHVHAKDTALDARNTAVNGTLDTKSYGDLAHRSWVFRTCGYGHGDEFWKPFVSMLRAQGYDGVLSIEHEDTLMSPDEGLTKAAAFLNQIMIKEGTTAAWWV